MLVEIFVRKYEICFSDLTFETNIESISLIFDAFFHIFFQFEKNILGAQVI